MVELSQLVGKYVSSAIIHGRESWGGDHKLANRHFKIYREAYCDLCKRGAIGINALKTLTDHESPFVRKVAAYSILPFDTRLGVLILKKVRREPHGIGHNAGITLSEWNKGKLRFPLKHDGKIIYVSSKELVCSLQTEWAKQGEDFGGLYAHKRHGRNTLSHYIRVLREYIRK